MNEEQKQWLKKVAALIIGAVDGGTAADYEQCVDAIQACLDNCPEP